MPLTNSRYDGLADWYDGWNEPNAARNAAEVIDLLGPGNGLCLDLGCGTGQYFDTLAATGRTVVGLDRSADQLRIARSRSRHIVQADAAALPRERPDDRTCSRAGRAAGPHHPRHARPEATGGARCVRISQRPGPN